MPWLTLKPVPEQFMDSKLELWYSFAHSADGTRTSFEMSSNKRVCLKLMTLIGFFCRNLIGLAVLVLAAAGAVVVELQNSNSAIAMPPPHPQPPPPPPPPVPPPPPPPPPPPRIIINPNNINTNINTNPNVNGGQPITGVGQLPVVTDQTRVQVYALQNIGRESVYPPFLINPSGFISPPALDSGVPSFFDNTPVISNAGGFQRGLRLPQLAAKSLSRAKNMKSGKNKIAAVPSSGSSVSAGSSIAQLNPGSVVVLHKSEPQTVITSAGTAVCSAGTSAFFYDRNNTVAIYCLDAGGKDEIKINVGKNLVSVLPGQEVVITRNQSAEFTQVNPGGGIAFKNPQAHNLDGGYKVFDAQINIASAISALKPLRERLVSGEPADKKALRQIIKNAIILNQM